jgi:hypothetical protein
VGLGSCEIDAIVGAIDLSSMQGAASPVSKTVLLLALGSIAGLALNASSPAKAADLYSLTGFDSGDVINVDDGSVTRAGFKFSVSTNKWINSLKVWVSSAAFTGEHQITLTDVSSNPNNASFARQTTISGTPTTGPGGPNCSYTAINAGNPALGGFCSIGITDYELQTGKTYSLSSTYANIPLGGGYEFTPQSYITSLNSTQAIFDSSVTFIANTYGITTPPQDSYGITAPDNYGNFGPNIGFGGGPPAPSSSVPAPLPLLGASLAMAYSRKIRSRIRSRAIG